MSPGPTETPHSFPFRLVDELWFEGGVGRASVELTASAHYAAPGEPWPLWLVVEALAQAILATAPPGGSSPGSLRLVGIHAARLCRSLGPGDRLDIEVREAATFGGLRRFSCRAVCSGAVAAVAEITVSR